MVKTTKTLKITAALAFVALLSVGVRPVCAQITDEGRAEKAVWSGYWWPTSKGQIAAPLKKYDALTGAKSAAWHLKNNPPGRNVPGWEGLCHAWSAASVLEIEPTKPLKVGRKTIGVGDQKAWLTICHDDDVANFYGDRFGDGVGSEDPQDVRPDEFWTTLRSHLRERKIPVVVDLACGAEVWNYPVYAYRVNLVPVGAGPLHRGTFEIWLADDAVPPDFVGIKRAYKKYEFEIDVRNGSIVAGSGKWIGASAKDHPDFVWVPYVVQTSNPEMSYAKVCELLGRRQAEFPDASSEDEREEPAPDSDRTPDDAENNGETPNNDAENNGETPNNDAETSNNAEKQARLREFIDSLKNYKTNFFFSFAPKGLQRALKVGELVRFDIIAESDGYVSVFSVNPEGRIDIIYPFNGADGRWESNSNQTTIPRENDPVRWRAVGPIGDVRVIAVMTENPLNFDDLKGGKGNGKADFNVVVEEANKENPRDVDKPTNKVLGWCETTIYVDKADTNGKGEKQ